MEAFIPEIVLPLEASAKFSPRSSSSAVARTVTECRIDPTCFDRFFAAMRSDLTVTCYRTWEELRGYMDGSASVIGEMMLPVLEPTSPGAFEPWSPLS